MNNYVMLFIKTMWKIEKQDKQHYTFFDSDLLERIKFYSKQMGILN